MFASLHIAWALASSSLSTNGNQSASEAKVYDASYFFPKK
jgi:hypothetical protein